MADANKPRKIAILGGGMGALTTAYELSGQPGWQDRFDITVYQLGWRLGGKCASSRGANARIEEHGIHGFMGSYYNALPLMADVYAELDRPPGAPLATFDEAFHGSNFTLMWEWRDDGLTPWPVRTPANDRSPTTPPTLNGLESAITAILDDVGQMLATAPHLSPLVDEGLHLVLDRARKSLSVPLTQGPDHPLVAEIQGARKMVAGAAKMFAAAAPGLATRSDDLRRALITLDYYATLIVGALQDNVAKNGFDVLDGENWSDWLARHGAHPQTLASPVPMITVNICYQSPDGDTSRAARMAAGAYLDWSLRSCCYMGALIWSFASGTGETVVAPMYEVLRRRGVKFEFFHKVDALRLSPCRTRVDAVEMTRQATLKDPEAGYRPLIDVKGLPSWPENPHYDQLQEGEYLRATGINLESWWNGWPNESFPHLMRPRVLRHGVDFDEVVLGVSIGAAPYICEDLIAESPDWRGMVAAVPTVQTQAMQLWLSKDMYELGWAEPLQPGELGISATYFCPPNGNGNFPDLLQWEDWPADNMPKALWYFCGLMPDYEPMPPFSDTDYPRRQAERVRTQCIQYLQSNIGVMLPKATVRANTGLGDPMGLDFDLLVDTRDAGAKGVMRFDSQFWRANIDPTERYVTTPPGSVAWRMEAWGSGFENLVLTGDWIYTGLNVGSFEGATMGGKLASYAISAYPPLSEIIGYPTIPRPPRADGRLHPPPPHEADQGLPQFRQVG